MIIEDKKQKISLDKIEQMEIVRSFSKKIQVKQYEPIEIFSSYKAILKRGATNEDIDTINDELAKKSEEDCNYQSNESYKSNKEPF